MAVRHEMVLAPGRLTPTAFAATDSASVGTMASIARHLASSDERFTREGCYDAA
jgi:hypothetical protein